MRRLLLPVVLSLVVAAAPIAQSAHPSTPVSSRPPRIDPTRLARLDQVSCPVCGITFLEFRKQGRLGCPHDYVCFADELEPLLANIHGETHHVGKVPKHGRNGAEQQTQLIRLRRELKEAVAEEQYEKASTLRDEIRKIEAAREKAQSQP